jgi:hypothetical protein
MVWRHPTTQPNYIASPNKKDVRKLNVELCRRFTGLQTIPQDRSYWTLCNLQPDHPNSEINQMLSLGLISDVSQFHGVDYRLDVIQANKRSHPKANWYHGEWAEVIEAAHSAGEFNPAFIYFDSTHIVEGRPVRANLAEIIPRCPEGTVLFLNVMMNNPRCRERYDADNLVDSLHRRVIGLRRWNVCGDEFRLPHYDYTTTGKTKMKTFLFYNGAFNDGAFNDSP